ncbi:hypothetical protein HYFRA_00005741 [Hymenoscyphus fraxineus]|uniref:Uncharacterized protein n=1 Tax=Hymenoscyphus fraxineus TaxID=746836 RepID=A0A9N9PQC7_9HELO|nr:hypothetical protein HYFRA_00005741 [Hymenoscyphus fraxineus]
MSTGAGTDTGGVEAPRGRSRFSKVLPNAPTRPAVPPKSLFRTISSPGPTLPPKDDYVDSMSTAMMIPRRAVGSTESISQVKPIAKVETISQYRHRARSTSISSAYFSDSPSLSNGSDSSSDIHSDDEPHSPSDSESGPPPPPKDRQREPTTPPSSSPQNLHHILAQPTAGFTKSPVAIDLWRRRSARSERSIYFSELRLERSNGSTARYSSPPQQQAQRQEQARPQPPPKPETRSLPALPKSFAGQQRKPVPIRPAPAPAPAQPDVDLMGNKLTKLKEKHSKSKLNDFGNEDPMIRQNGNGTTTQNQDPTKSAPTPTFDFQLRKENLRNDSSPSLPSEYSTPPPEVPAKSQSRPTTRGTNGTTTLLPSLSVATSEEPIDFLSATSHSRGTSETLTISSEPTIMQSPQPHKPNDTARILTPEVSPRPSSSLATSPLALSSPTKKIHFPTFPAPVAKPGTVFPGPPISNVQLECYQNHRFMRSTRNTLCPVACMVCQRRDAEQRWKCSWCCLSTCGSCMQVLAAVPGKDLKTCLEKVSRQNQVAIGIAS